MTEVVFLFQAHTYTQANTHIHQSIGEEGGQGDSSTIQSVEPDKDKAAGNINQTPAGGYYHWRSPWEDSGSYSLSWNEAQRTKETYPAKDRGTYSAGEHFRDRKKFGLLY